MQHEKKEKVFVLASGGVDSSASLLLLKEMGYDVTGVFIKAWHPEFLECGWEEDRRDAMRVCVALDIPFITIDMEKEYKRCVIDHTIVEYKKGRTPNPDVMCNKMIKFGAVYEKLKEMGADKIATGHYARVGHDGVLMKGKDNNKDQSYFLWTLKKELLGRIIFPVGDMLKSEVRELAKKNSLYTANKKESQGLCFVGKIDFKEFIKSYVDVSVGDVLNIKNEVIGKHEGAELYTIGERRGFTVTKKSPNDKPYYVVRKDKKNNTITVSMDHDEEYFLAKDAFLAETNWFSVPVTNKKYECRVRYRQKLIKCVVSRTNNRCRISFEKKIKGVASGQSLVIYDGEYVLGGGVIT